MLEVRGAPSETWTSPRMASQLKYHCADELVVYADLCHVLA
jgi:hypothetical protein